MRRLLVASIFIIALFTLTACTPQSKAYKDSRFVMDTLIEITVYGPNGQEAVKEAFGEFDRIQAIANQYDPDSQLSKVNQAAGMMPVVVDMDLIIMAEQSRKLAENMDDAFDVTIGPLTDLWGVGKKGDYVPSDGEIAAVLPLVNYRLVQVDQVQRTIYLPQIGMKLDMGGIAKGYAVDKAIAKLKAKGIRAALINAGGSIRVLGSKPDGTPWRIGVQDPRQIDGVLAKLALTQWDTMETSGDYQRFIMKDNVRYAHIIDPRTGKQPRELISVTIVMNDASAGDVFSTALFVLGLEKGMALLKDFPGVEAIFVTAAGKVVVTPGLEGKIEL